MSINDETWSTIEKLMTKSIWGTKSSNESLVQNLENEVKEFIPECLNNNVENSLEEAADIIMILFCILYRLNINNKDFKIDDVMAAIIGKLHRRYSHIYNKDEHLEEEAEEESIWHKAKKEEATRQRMFCNNKECSMYGIVGGDNVYIRDRKCICNSCNRPIKKAKESIFFYRRKDGKQYIQQISDYIIQYVRGNKSSPERLRTDNYKAFSALCNDILKNEDTKAVFIGYISKSLNINRKEVEDFLNIVEHNRKEMNNQNKINSEQDILRYLESVNSDNYSNNMFPVKLNTKIHSELSGLTMDVIQRVERVAEFQARSWNHQLVHKYLLSCDNNNPDRIIECMTIFHYLDDSVRDLTIELSNMYNCIVGCKFCASGALPESVYVLEPIDYLRQLNTCIKKSGINPAEFKEFYVSFAGIGEPSAVYKNIAHGMALIHDFYPHVRFNIATFGYDKNCFDYWNTHSHYIRTLQIPYYSYNSSKLHDIVSNLPSDYDFTEVLSKAIDYKTAHNDCRIKINYIVIKDFNDTAEDAEYLCRTLSQYKDRIAIKVAYLNYTKPGEENDLVSPGKEKLTEINDSFLKKGFTSYIFGTSFNTELGCGQLVQRHISSSDC